MNLSDPQKTFGNERLQKVEKSWGVSKETAVKILLGYEYKTFWEWVNAEDYLLSKRTELEKS